MYSQTIVCGFTWSEAISRRWSLIALIYDCFARVWFYSFIKIIAIMQDKDLFGGIIGKYSDCIDETTTATNGIQKNDDCKIASNSSAPRPCKFVLKKMQYSRNFHAIFPPLFWCMSEYHECYLYSHIKYFMVFLLCFIVHAASYYCCCYCKITNFSQFSLLFSSWLGLSACANNITIFWSIHGIHLACKHFSWYCGHGRPITKCNPSGERFIYR